jgi:magnesium chelatase family protein
VCAKEQGVPNLIVPHENAHEAAVVDGLNVYGLKHLTDVVNLIERPGSFQPVKSNGNGKVAADPMLTFDFRDVKGQETAKRALEISAAGGHNILMVGPPGSGKTMLASRLPGLLPPMTEHEALEAAAVQSLTRDFTLRDWGRRPFRAPHHTASSVALVGGSSLPRPGEISLAHHGVLFLDELPEFDRHVLESLREPLESGTITISRAARQAEFPARFQFIAAMNPCPCGYFGDVSGRCNCSPERVRSYRARLSGPLLDRLDMHLEVPAIARDVLLAEKPPAAETSAEIRRRVHSARERALARTGHPNARLGNKDIERDCALAQPEREWFEQALARFHLSARAFHRILKVARTIADLGEADRIDRAHLSEAIQYRLLDRAN